MKRINPFNRECTADMSMYSVIENSNSVQMIEKFPSHAKTECSGNTEKNILSFKTDTSSPTKFDNSDSVSSPAQAISPIDVSFSFPIKNLPQITFVPTKLTTRDFKDVEFLGNGSNSYLYVATRNGEKVVVKLLKESLRNRRVAEQELVFEAGILARLKHPNIININGVGEKIRKFIVLEYLEGGALSHVLQQPKANTKSSLVGFAALKKSKVPYILGLRNIIYIAQEIAKGLKYLHQDFNEEAMIIHRDLKPQNIGFTKDGQLKIFDFGLMACVKRRALSTDSYKMTGFTGTIIYMAPEVAQRLPYTEKVDIYSFGMILWQMTSGLVPFAGMYRDEYMQKVVKGGFRPKIRDDLPLPLIQLIERCWDCNPIIRPDCGEILSLLDSAMESLDMSQRRVNSFGGIMRFFRGGEKISKVADESSLLKVEMMQKL